MGEIMLKIDNVSKIYRLGQIGGTTLRDELQRTVAKLRNKEDPTRRIGTKNYGRGERFTALNGVSLEVKKGERVGIIGHNGAGKSTLLKLISRVTAPTGGTISMNGRVASMLEVGTGFHGELTGRENIYMNGAILGMTKKEIDSKIEDIIEFSECRQFIDTPVKRYSSGMYVKLAFSVAAHLDSEIMIMDEVLAVGDMAFQQKCLDKMNDVSRSEGRTILYVSHNMNTIRQLCDRVIVFEHGKVIYDGSVEEGIEIYSGEIDVLEDELVFRDEDKINNSSESLFEIGSVEINDRKRAVFTIGEKFEFTLKYRCLKKLDDFIISAVIYYSDQSPVTLANSKRISVDPNENGEIRILLDLSPLAPGKYTLELCAYQVDGFGGTVFHDIIKKDRIVFEVQATDFFNQGRAWNHSLWGHTLSDELLVNIK